MPLPPNLVIDTSCPIRSRSGSVDSLDGAPEELSPADLSRLKDDVANLIANDILLVAVDADLTLFRVHTGGKWKGSPEGLSRHIRPLFRAFIPECLAAGLHVAIVTFSPQAQLIREALQIALPETDLSGVLVRGGQRQVVCEDGELADVSHWDGGRKQKHIGSVVERLSARGQLIRPQEIVLVDDDLFNVEEARDHGMRGALFNLDGVSRLPRPRRRGSVAELECRAEGMQEDGERTSGEIRRLPAMARAKSMPLEEAPLGDYCASAEGT